MTVAELIEELTQLDGNEEVPLEAYLPDLSYIVDALEQWVDLTEIAGRTFHPEVDAFLSKARAAL